MRNYTSTVKSMKIMDLLRDIPPELVNAGEFGILHGPETASQCKESP